MSACSVIHREMGKRIEFEFLNDYSIVIDIFFTTVVNSVVIIIPSIDKARHVVQAWVPSRVLKIVKTVE